MIRLVLLPVALLAAWAIRVALTPWCEVLDHDWNTHDQPPHCVNCGLTYAYNPQPWANQ